MNEPDPDFIEYARQCTDAQLEHVLEKEWNAFKHRDYVSALTAAAERGWTVDKGKRRK